MDTGVSIITPNKIDDGKPAKTVFLLHGLCGSSRDWIDLTQLVVFAGEFDAFIVMPEVGRSYYCDMTLGQKYFTYVADELPALCRQQFNMSREAADTAVMGNSMGGYGALKCALSRPETFGCCCAFSSACLFIGEEINALRSDAGRKIAAEMFGLQLIIDFQATFGHDLTLRPEDDPVHSARRLAADPNRPRFYSACGSVDGFREMNRRYAEEMGRLGYHFIYEEWDGGHDWHFFNQALRHGLDFFFHGNPSGRAGE